MPGLHHIYSLIACVILVPTTFRGFFSHLVCSRLSERLQFIPHSLPARVALSTCDSAFSFAAWVPATLLTFPHGNRTLWCVWVFFSFFSSFVVSLMAFFLLRPVHCAERGARDEWVIVFHDIFNPIYCPPRVTRSPRQWHQSHGSRLLRLCASIMGRVSFFSFFFFFKKKRPQGGKKSE